MKKPWRRCALALLLALMLAALSGCGRRAGETPTVLLDGAPFAGGAVHPGAASGARVYITLDGRALIDLPFGEAHTVVVRPPEGGENTVAITGEAVYMLSADCDNQDCVEMGAVTLDNLETRVLGGFIICLPHRVSVEVRGE